MCFNTSQTEGQLNYCTYKKLRSYFKENKFLLHKGQYFFVIRTTLYIRIMRPKIRSFQILTFKWWIHGAKSTHRLIQQDWESAILPVHTNFPLRFCAPWRPENVCSCSTSSISDLAFHDNLTYLLSHHLPCMYSACIRNDKQTRVYNKFQSAYSSYLWTNCFFQTRPSD